MLDDFFALSQSERYPYVLAMALVVGLIFGIFISRESIRRQPIYGGLMAEFFHYLATSTIATIIPMVFIGIPCGLHILQFVATGLTMMLLTLTSLVIFAFFEIGAKPAEIKPQRELD